MRTQRASLFGTAAALLVLALMVPVSAQNAGQTGNSVRPFTDADWPRYTGDLGGLKYSKLTQINTTNVSKLASAWTFAGGGAQQTPIVIDGVLYASTPTGVVAIGGDTGKEVWRHGAVPPAGGRGGRGGGAQ